MSSPVKLTNENINELREAFMLFDFNKSGKIAMRDIGPVVRSIGLTPSEAEIREMMHDVSATGEIDLTTLVQLITKKVTNPQSERAEDLRDLFRLYDKDGKGVLTIKEMKHLLTSVGEKLTEDEADELIKMTGCSTNGQVNYDKFIQVILKG